MANLIETPKWEDGIYRIELTDPVVGGEDGIDNIQAKQLGNRTLWLKKKVEQNEDVVNGYSPEMQEAIFGLLQISTDLAALAMREHEQTRLTRFQEITALIKNRGIKTGVSITKSTTATRNISCSDGVVFMHGREYPVANQINTAAVASNTGDKPGIVIIYMFLTANGEIDMAATTLDGPMPEGAIELARATVPAGNTEQNDPYLENVTLADSSRREPNWPLVQRAPASIAVALNRSLPDNAYMVQVEIQSCAGGGLQVGEVRVMDKLKNGFKLVTNGTADDIQVRMLVEHPAI